MPAKSQDNMKGTSPSKLIQGVVNDAWGQQQKGRTNPQQVLNQQVRDRLLQKIGEGGMGEVWEADQ